MIFEVQEVIHHAHCDDKGIERHEILNSRTLVNSDHIVYINDINTIDPGKNLTNHVYTNSAIILSNGETLYVKETVKELEEFFIREEKYSK